MASPDSFWNGMMSFVIGAFTSLFLFMGVAMPAEKTLAEFEGLDIGSGTIYDFAGKWSGSYNDAVFWMNLMYIVCVAPIVLGLIIWVLSAIRTQDYDVLAEPEVSPAPTTITPEEMQYYQMQGRL